MSFIAIMFFLVHAVLVAIMTARDENPSRHNRPAKVPVGMSQTVIVQDYFKQSLDEFAIVNKDPKRIKEIIERMKNVFEQQSGGILPNRAIFWTGGSRYFDFMATATNIYYLTGPQHILTNYLSIYCISCRYDLLLTCISVCVYVCMCLNRYQNE